MIVGTAIIKLYAPWVHSLKEKRMVVKSIVQKVRQRFNVSAAEVDAMDVHQTIMIGMSCVSNQMVHARSIMDQAVRYIEDHTEAIIEDITIELL